MRFCRTDSSVSQSERHGAEHPRERQGRAIAEAAVFDLQHGKPIADACLPGGAPVQQPTRRPT